jgi:hypothetical protein
MGCREAPWYGGPFDVTVDGNLLKQLNSRELVDGRWGMALNHGSTAQLFVSNVFDTTALCGLHYAPRRLVVAIRNYRAKHDHERLHFHAGCDRHGRRASGPNLQQLL